MANMLDIVVSDFDLQLCYYIHFWTNTLGKTMKPFISPAMSSIVPLLFLYFDIK